VKEADMHNNAGTGISAVAFGGLGLLVGMVVGTVTGVLLAPQTGEKTRKQLMDLAGDAREKMNYLASEAKETVHDLADKTRQLTG
jgi:gas vesicle protein